MKREDLKNLGKKTGVSRLWIAVAAAAGAAIAYLADPERGTARRQAAGQQLSGLTQAASERTSRWRQLVSARLSGKSKEQPPQQVVLPQDERSASHEAPAPSTGTAPSVGNAETEKPGG